MTPAEFEQWFRALRLEPATCDLIAIMRVTSRANNVSGAYPSRKMGMTIQFESHTVELWLKDWLIRAVSAALDDGSDTLTLERLQEQALSISQCEQMALDAIEGEQKLNYTEGRREHLWRLLQGEEPFAPVPW
jgi:hypothetical protein